MCYNGNKIAPMRNAEKPSGDRKMSETRDREPDRTQGTGPSGATGAPRRLWKAQYVFLLILAVGVLVTLYVTQVRREKCVKIGAVLSLSGGTAYVGEEVRDGMLLAVDEVNAWDGIQGRQIELIIEDCQTDVEKGQEAFNRIEAAHQPVLYISTLSSISIALAPLAEENQVVLIGMAATAPELTGQNEWVFRYFPTARDEVPPILAILEELRVTELGMIYVDDA
jgi:ABC-type branched-subunit amino acid transport system substrate-binding protein